MSSAQPLGKRADAKRWNSRFRRRSAFQDDGDDAEEAPTAICCWDGMLEKATVTRGLARICEYQQCLGVRSLVPQRP